MHGICEYMVCVCVHMRGVCVHMCVHGVHAHAVHAHGVWAWCVSVCMMCVCVHVCECMPRECVWWSEDNGWKSVLSFPMDSRDPAQEVRFYSKSLLSHLKNNVSIQLFGSRKPNHLSPQ